MVLYCYMSCKSSFFAGGGGVSRLLCRSLPSSSLGFITNKIMISVIFFLSPRESFFTSFPLSSIIEVGGGGGLSRLVCVRHYLSSSSSGFNKHVMETRLVNDFFLSSASVHSLRLAVVVVIYHASYVRHFRSSASPGFNKQTPNVKCSPEGARDVNKVEIGEEGRYREFCFSGLQECTHTTL